MISRYGRIAGLMCYRYQDVVRQGDQLITKLQKYGQVVRLRGSERG